MEVSAGNAEEELVEGRFGEEIAVQTGDHVAPLTLEKRSQETAQAHQILCRLRHQVDLVVMIVQIPPLSPADMVVPGYVVDELVDLATHSLQFGQGHEHQDPLDIIHEALECPGIGDASLMETQAGLPSLLEAQDPVEDAGLTAAILQQDAPFAWVDRPRLWPIEFQNLQRQLAGGELKRRCA